MGSAFNLVASLLWGITPEYFDLVVAIAERVGTVDELTRLALAAKQEKDHASTLAFIEQRLAFLETDARLKGVALQVGERARNTRRVEMRDGIAILPVEGAIFRRANLFSELSGNATSVQVMATDFNTTIKAPETQGMIINGDTPGGDINGISEMAGHIRAAADASGKPVWVYTGGMLCSAGLWLGRAAQKIHAHPTSVLGSIGVMAIIRTGKDNSKVIISEQSPNKNLDPNTPKGETALQQQVNRAASFFLADLAKYSGKTVEEIQEKWGKGGTMFGADALDAGMVDELSTFEETIAQMQDVIATQKRTSVALAAVTDVEIAAASRVVAHTLASTMADEERTDDNMALSDSLKLFIAGLPADERAELLAGNTQPTQPGGNAGAAQQPPPPPAAPAAAASTAGGGQPDLLAQALERAVNAECTAFFATVANKVTPAERAGLEGTYKALAKINDGGAALEGFKATLVARSVHPAMAGEQVPNNGKVAVTVLPNDGSATGTAQTQEEKDAAQVAACLSMTTVGQQAAAALKAGEIAPAAHA
jgi:capsid assembly protease